MRDEGASERREERGDPLPGAMRVGGGGGERDEGTRGEMGCVGAGLGLEAAGPWRFSGPAWLDRPKRPAGLLFSLSYFL